MITFDFPCTSCGACCRHVNLSAQTKFLDRGNGICQYFNEQSATCSIYETRPDICRVDKQFILNYSKNMTWEQFVALNLKSCEILQKMD